MHKIRSLSLFHFIPENRLCHRGYTLQNDRHSATEMRSTLQASQLFEALYFPAKCCPWRTTRTSLLREIPVQAGMMRALTLSLSGIIVTNPFLPHSSAEMSRPSEEEPWAARDSECGGLNPMEHAEPGPLVFLPHDLGSSTQWHSTHVMLRSSPLGVRPGFTGS